MMNLIIFTVKNFYFTYDKFFQILNLNCNFTKNINYLTFLHFVFNQQQQNKQITRHTSSLPILYNCLLLRQEVKGQRPRSQGHLMNLKQKHHVLQNYAMFTDIIKLK